MNKTALITGATSGIGAAYAKHFASQGYDLILTGRRTEILQKVAEDIAAQFKVDVKTIIAELSDDSDIQKVIEAIRENDNIQVLINNAGYGQSEEPFHEMDFEDCEKMIKVHNLVPMKLMQTVLPGMLNKKSGTIINVASIAALFPVKKLSVYCSSKAYLKHFTEIQYLELRVKGLKIQALCPGPVDTDFTRNLPPEKRKQYKGIRFSLSAEAVVKYSLQCLKKNKPVCVPGFTFRLANWFVSLMPRSLFYWAEDKFDKR